MPEFTGDPKSHPRSEFSTELIGTCLCGSIRVTIKDSELFTRKRGHLCHCANCRKSSGSYVASNLNIEEEKVTIEDSKGTRKRYNDTGGSGKIVERNFCGECGSPICAIVENYPGRIVVKMGIFPRIPDPEFESFAAHRHEWQGKHDGLRQYKFLPGGPLLDE